MTLTANTTNGVNDGHLGNTVYLSPEQFFFANATTLYIADSGAPKNGNAAAAGLGDGGPARPGLGRRGDLLRRLPAPARRR